MSYLERLERQVRARLPTERPLEERSRDRTVAIACQGGGSHAAFTAGVLGELLENLPAGYRVVGLSGTSGGAVSATAAWYGHLAPERTPMTTLEALWEEVAATTVWQRWVNEVTLVKTGVSGGVGSGSPFASRTGEWVRQELEAILTTHVDFEAFPSLAAADDSPALLVGATDVETGAPALFEDGEVTPSAVVASAAVPHLFDAVEIDGSHYWDGFLAQNPPIREFVVDESIPPVDELWVVQLTPRRSPRVPTSRDGIDDRTQQLVENLSVSQELRFVETVNDWVADGTLDAPHLTEATVRRVQLPPERSRPSRLDRRRSVISDLYRDGQAAAVEFLADLG